MSDRQIPFRSVANHIQEFREELANVAAAPADGPKGLPGRFYADEQYFQHEWDNVLRNGWHCAGRVDEVPNVGDYFTLMLLGEPVVIVGLGSFDFLGSYLVTDFGKEKPLPCPPE